MCADPALVVLGAEGSGRPDAEETAGQRGAEGGPGMRTRSCVDAPQGTVTSQSLILGTEFQHGSCAR